MSCHAKTRQDQSIDIASKWSLGLRECNRLSKSHRLAREKMGVVLESLDYPLEILKKANQQKDIIQTVVAIEDLMETYLALYRAIPKNLVTDLVRLCSFVPIPKSKPFHTNVSTLQELYQSALNAYPLFKKIVQTVADSTNAQLEM
jgi:hypothetical protein